MDHGPGEKHRDPIGTPRRGAAGGTYTVNVSSLVPTSGGTVTIRGSSTSADGAGYFSKEGSTTSGPRLQLTCG